MNLLRLTIVVVSLSLGCGLLDQVRAANGNEAGKTANTNEAAQKRIEAKSDHLLKGLKLADADKATRVKSILTEWLTTLSDWHSANDPKLKELWTRWSQARAVVPKDEFPGEVIAHEIVDFYASLKPAYASFTNKLATELTPEQVDALKETWSRSPGMKRTYNAYLEIAPGLNDDQKKVISHQMYLAREEAMLTDSDKEIVNIFKCHKVKVEQFVGSLEWEKLHRAFANRGKSKPATEE